MLCIAFYESSYCPTVYNGICCWGLWQISTFLPPGAFSAEALLTLISRRQPSRRARLPLHHQRSPGVRAFSFFLSFYCSRPPLQCQHQRRLRQPRALYSGPQRLDHLGQRRLPQLEPLHHGCRQHELHPHLLNGRVGESPLLPPLALGVDKDAFHGVLRHSQSSLAARWQRQILLNKVIELRLIRKVESQIGALKKDDQSRKTHLGSQ